MDTNIRTSSFYLFFICFAYGQIFETYQPTRMKNTLYTNKIMLNLNQQLFKVWIKQYKIPLTFSTNDFLKKILCVFLT